MNQNLSYYRIFYTVAGTGNISKAAESLFISQPAISKSISKLEEGLGLRLFDRSPKGVRLTAEGEILYQHISQAFDNISQGEEEIRRINELGIGQLRIGVSTSLCKHILLTYLQDFIVDNPHIKVILDCHSTVNTLKLLQEGKLDIGLICHTSIPKGYSYRELTKIHDIFVASNTYLDNLHLREQEEREAEVANPWLFAGNLTSIINSAHTDNDSAAKLSRLTAKEIIEKSNLMLLEKNNVTRTHIDDYFVKENIFPNQILEINNMDLLIDFASIGMGVASVVREFATDYLESGQVIELPLDNPIEERTVGFVFNDNKAKPAALVKFLEFCKV